MGEVLLEGQSTDRLRKSYAPAKYLACLPAGVVLDVRANRDRGPCREVTPVGRDEQHPYGVIVHPGITATSTLTP